MHTLDSSRVKVESDEGWREAQSGKPGPGKNGGDLELEVPEGGGSPTDNDDDNLLLNVSDEDLKALWSRVASAALWSHWALTGQFDEGGGRPFRFTCTAR